MMPDEQRLVQQARDGSKEAFAELVRCFRDRIFGFIMRMTADREAALDLTQDTFLAAYQGLEGFRGDSSFSTWLYQIAANKTRNYLKRAQRETSLPDYYDEAAPGAGPDAEYRQKEQLRLLLVELSSLPHKQRLAFTLRFFEHMKFDDIARVQETSVSAVKTNFAEALKKLKARLG
jgi:RNA polymerase sigma factor (sigma-70 family)